MPEFRASLDLVSFSLLDRFVRNVFDYCVNMIPVKKNRGRLVWVVNRIHAFGDEFAQDFMGLLDN